MCSLMEILLPKLLDENQGLTKSKPSEFILIDDCLV